MFREEKPVADAPNPKMGRPKLQPDQKSGSKRFSIVLPAKLADKVEAQAKIDGLSRNAEITTLIERGLATNSEPRVIFGSKEIKAITVIIAQAIHSYQISENGCLWDEPGAHDDMKTTVGLILDCFGPNPGTASTQEDEHPAHRRARTLLTSYLIESGYPEGEPRERSREVALTDLPEELFDKLKRKTTI
jgi:hypothetical protein